MESPQKSIVRIGIARSRCPSALPICLTGQSTLHLVLSICHTFLLYFLTLFAHLMRIM